MKKNRVIATLVLAVASLTMTSFVKAQGCSDAGFCTVGGMKPHSADSVYEGSNALKIGAGYGKADFSISTFGNYIEYSRSFTQNFSADLRMTSIVQSGNGISEFGLSDVYLTTNLGLGKNLSLTTGVKIPLSKGDRVLDSLPLPMDYQSSLGTFDIIVGLGYVINRLQLAAALQQPLTQNENTFLAENYPADSPLRAFYSTNDFKRSGDVLLRVSYPIPMSDGLQMTPSLLPIYHMQNDKYTDANGVEKEITGSQGLTLNFNLYFDLALDSNQALQMNVGVPFIVRDARPDGLTRSFVANLEYAVRF